MYKTMDLCAGIGGMRRGFELTGEFENVLSCEIDKAACRTYEHLYGENPEGDITSEELKVRAEEAKADILLAGFPCQPFSIAGKIARRTDMGFDYPEKGVIFYHIAGIIKRTRPKALFFENVEGLLSNAKGETFREIIRILELELDYKVIGVDGGFEGDVSYNPRSFVRNSMNFGIPQRRKRVYIMAFDRRWYGERALRKLPESLPDGNDLCLYQDLNDLLEFGAQPEYYMAQGYLDELKRHKVEQKAKGRGFGYAVVNPAGEEHPVANTILATGGSGKERNLVYDPQESIAGMEIPGKRSPLNDEGIRMMTPKEWGKLQGFVNYAFMKNGEDTFSFPEGIPKTQQYKLFGNSVTIPVIQTMAQFMLECFKTLEGEDNG